MQLIHDLLSSVAVHHLGWMLLHSLWLMLIPAGLLALAMLVVPKRMSNTRYAVSTLSMLLMVGSLAVAALFVPRTTLTEEASETLALQGEPVIDPLAQPPLVAPMPTGDAADPNNMFSALDPTGQPVFGPVDADPFVADSTPAVEPIPNLEAASGLGERSAVDEPATFYAHTVSVLEPYVAWAVPLWLVGVILLGLWHLGGLIATHRLRSIGTRPAPYATRLRMQGLMRQMGITRAVHLLESSVVQGPAVIGFIKPVILIPASVFTGLTPQQLEAILAHELAHIKRHDYLVNLVQTLVVTLLFYHPAVWWVSKQIRNERECCCDDIVLKLTPALGSSEVDRKLDYAKALTQVAMLSNTSRRTHLAVAADSGSLFERIKRMMGMEDTPGSAIGPKAWLAGLLVLLLAVALPITLVTGQGGEFSETEPIAEEEAADFIEEIRGKWYVQYREDNYLSPDAWERWTFEEGGVWSVLDGSYDEQGRRQPGKNDAEAMVYEVDENGKLTLTIDPGEGGTPERIQGNAAFEDEHLVISLTIDGGTGEYILTRDERPKAMLERRRTDRMKIEQLRKTMSDIGVAWFATMRDRPDQQPLDLVGFGFEWQRLISPFNQDIEVPRDIGTWGEAKRKQWVIDQADIVYLPRLGDQVIEQPIVLFERPIEGRRSLMVYRDNGESIRVGGMVRSQLDELLKKQTGKGLDAWGVAEEGQDHVEGVQPASHVPGGPVMLVSTDVDPDRAFYDLDRHRYITPPADLDLQDSVAVRAWMRESGADLTGRFDAEKTRGLIAPETVLARLLDQDWHKFDAKAINKTLIGNHFNMTRNGGNLKGTAAHLDVEIVATDPKASRTWAIRSWNEQQERRGWIVQFLRYGDDPGGLVVFRYQRLNLSHELADDVIAPSQRIAAMQARLKVIKESITAIRAKENRAAEDNWRWRQYGIEAEEIEKAIKELKVPADPAKAILGKWYVQWSQDRWIEPGSRFSYEFKPSGAIEIVMDGEKLRWGETELTADTVRLDMGQGGQSLLYNYAINNEGSLILEEKDVDPPTFMILTKEPKGTQHHQEQRGKAGQKPDEVGDGEKQAADDLLQLIAQTHRINESKINTWVGGALVTDEHVGGPLGDNNMTSLVAFQTDKDQGKRWRWEVTAATKTVDGEQADDPRQISVQDEMVRGHVHYKLSDGLKRADGPWERTMVLLPLERGAHKIGMKSRSLDPFWYLTQDGQSIDRFLDYLLSRRDRLGEEVRVTRQGSVILIENPLEERQWTHRYRFDLAQGGNLTQVRVDQGDNFWYTDIAYEQINGVWVPKRYEQKQQTASHGMRRRVVVFRDQLINHPVDGKAFTMEAMGILPGTRVSDHMRGLAYEYPNEQDARRIRYRRPTGQSYTAAGITLHEVAVFNDGGTLAASYTDAEGTRVEAAFNGHRHSDTRHRMYAGAMHHTHEGAELVPEDAAIEREVIEALRNWVSASFTDEQLAAIRAKQRAAIEARQRPDLAEDEAWAIQILDGLKAVEDHRQKINGQDELKVIGRDEKEARRVTLPDMDEPQGLEGRVLDLRTGELLDFPEGPNERKIADHFEKLGKGDLMFESAAGQSMLIVLRDGVLTYNQDGDRTEVERVIRGVTVYPIKPEDESVNVKTAAGDVYTLKIVENRGGQGIELRYARVKNALDLPGEAAAPQDKPPLMGRWVWCDDKIDRVVGVAEIDAAGGMTIFDLDGGAKHFRLEINEDTGVWQLDGVGDNDLSTLTPEFIGKDRIVLKGDEGRELLFREDAYEEIKEQTLKLRELQGAQEKAQEQGAVRRVVIPPFKEVEKPFLLDLYTGDLLGFRDVDRDGQGSIADQIAAQLKRSAKRGITFDGKAFIGWGGVSFRAADRRDIWWDDLQIRPGSTKMTSYDLRPLEESVRVYTEDWRLFEFRIIDRRDDGSVEIEYIERNPIVGRWNVSAEQVVDFGVQSMELKADGTALSNRPTGQKAAGAWRYSPEARTLSFQDSEGAEIIWSVEVVGDTLTLRKDQRSVKLTREKEQPVVPEQHLDEKPALPDKTDQAESLQGRWFIQRMNGHWMLEDETAVYEFRADGVVAQAADDEAIRPSARYVVDWDAKQIRYFSLEDGAEQGSTGFSLDDDDGVLTLRGEEFAGKGRRLEILVVLTRNAAGTPEHRRARAQVATHDNPYARMRSAGQIRAVHQALVIASQANRAAYPESIGALLEGDFVTPGYLLVPWSGVEVPKDFRQWKKQDKVKWAEANSSYAFVMAGQKQTLDTERVILFELPLVEGTTMIGVCYDDGHSNYLPYAEANALVQKQTGRDLMGWMKHLGREQRKAEAGDGDVVSLLEIIPASFDKPSEDAEAVRVPRLDRPVYPMSADVILTLDDVVSAKLVEGGIAGLVLQLTITPEAAARKEAHEREHPDEPVLIMSQGKPIGIETTLRSGPRLHVHITGGGEQAQDAFKQIVEALSPLVVYPGSYKKLHEASKPVGVPGQDRPVYLTGHAPWTIDDFAEAKQVLDELGQPVLQLTLKRDPAKRLGIHTRNHLVELLLIKINGKPVTAPAVHDVLKNKIQISGGNEETRRAFQSIIKTIEASQEQGGDEAEAEARAQEAGKRLVYIGGDVERPGAYAIPEGKERYMLSVLLIAVGLPVPDDQADYRIVIRPGGNADPGYPRETTYRRAMDGGAQMIVLPGEQVKVTRVTRDAVSLVEVFPASFEKPDPASKPVEVPGRDRPVYYKGNTLLITDDFLDASSAPGELGRPVLQLKLKPEAAKRLEAYTADHLGQPIVIVVDGKPVSAPTVRAKLQDRFQISGDGEAFDKAVKKFVTAVQSLQKPEEELPDASGAEAGVDDDWPEDEGGVKLQGLQARLSGEPTIKPGEMPSLTIDLRNTGERKMRFVNGSEKVELRIGNTWYSATVFRTGGVDVFNLRPGERAMGIEWSPLEAFEWRDGEGKAPVFGPGEQEVSLAIYVDPQDGEFGNPVRLITNTFTLNPGNELEGEEAPAEPEAQGAGDDPWQAEMNRLSQLLIKEVGRDAVVQGYEALIATHPDDERVGEAMLMIAGIYGSVSIPEMGIEQDRDKSKHWLERAAAESQEGSLPWIEARLQIVQWLPIEDPEATRALIEPVREHAAEDSLTMIRVELSLMTTYIQEQDWASAVGRAQTILGWYDNPDRIPDERNRKSRVDHWIDTSARLIVYRLDQNIIEGERREALLQRLREANPDVMKRIELALETPRRTVRHVVRDYMTAALAGDRKTQERLSVPGKAPARYGGEGLAGVKADQAWVNDQRALVVTTSTVVQQPRGLETGYLVFELVKDDDAGWRIDDIDFEDEAGLEKAIERFERANKSKRQRDDEVPAEREAGKAPAEDGDGVHIPAPPKLRGFESPRGYDLTIVPAAFEPSRDRPNTPGVELPDQDRPVYRDSLYAWTTLTQVEQAALSKDADGKPVLELRFDHAAAKRLAEHSRGHLGKPMLISIQGEPVSAPLIREAFGERLRVVGRGLEDKAAFEWIVKSVGQVDHDRKRIAGTWVSKHDKFEGGTDTPDYSVSDLSADGTWTNVSLWGTLDKPTRIKVHGRGKGWGLYLTDPIFAHAASPAPSEPVYGLKRRLDEKTSLGGGELFFVNDDTFKTVFHRTITLTTVSNRVKGELRQKLLATIERAVAKEEPNRQVEAPAEPEGEHGAVANLEATLPWGLQTEQGLRCRFVEPQKMFTGGNQPTVQVVVQNVSLKPVVWSHLNLYSRIAGAENWTLNPTTEVSFNESARYATAGEVTEHLGVGHPGLFGDEPLETSYLYLRPGGEAVLTLRLFKTEQLKAGWYQIECQEILRDNVARGLKDMLHCPPVVIGVVEAGEKAPPNVDPTNWPKGEWGPKVDGMQLRLNSNSFHNPGGKTPQLYLDLRNFGEKKMQFVPAESHMAIEVDGVWYRPEVSLSRWLQTFTLGPGNRWQDFQWAPLAMAKWTDKGGNPLVFGDGGHTIRVAILVYPQEHDPKGSVRLVSNAIQPKAADNQPEADPQARLDAAPEKLRYGDRPLDEYTVDQALRLPMYGYPEWVEAIQRLIRDNPQHPRVDELRYFALMQDAHAQMLRLSEQEMDLRELKAARAVLRGEMIKRLQALTDQVGFDSTAGYKCQSRIAHYYRHETDEPRKAYEINLKLVDHPYVRGEEVLMTDRPSNDLIDLERDLRRIKLYERICATASRAKRDGQGGEDELHESIGKYGYLVLQYPYIKGEALRTTHRQTLYRDFRQTHQSAAGCYLSAFRDNHEMLKRVNIIHGSEQFKWHQQYLEETKKQGKEGQPNNGAIEG